MTHKQGLCKLAGARGAGYAGRDLRCSRWGQPSPDCCPVPSLWTPGPHSVPVDVRTLESVLLEHQRVSAPAQPQLIDWSALPRATIVRSPDGDERSSSSPPSGHVPWHLARPETQRPTRCLLEFHPSLVPLDAVVAVWNTKSDGASLHSLPVSPLPELVVEHWPESTVSGHSSSALPSPAFC